ncbi:MAG TPA: amidophosphoribosyltransferase [Verrucomicrobiae bacterium]|nr:amidophosphoribosyltransferase [Verrucomicrobiae bacterium]
MNPEENTRPRHYCGLFGIYGHPNAAELTYYGLYALQHRGQESAGITASDGVDLRTYKGMGLVGQVFDKNILRSLPGRLAIGHVRYSTTGSTNLKNAQPLVVDCARGQIAIGHNGNLTNAARLRSELEDRGSIFQTTVDSEIILHLLARPDEEDRVHSLEAVMRKIQGAYSLVIMGEDELIGVRDPFGFRPLVLGRLPVTDHQSPITKHQSYAYVLASETCALDLIQAEYVRDVAPGEIVVIDPNGVRSVNPWAGTQQSHAFCIFEFIYFARPDSDFYNKNVAAVRINLGRQLAREHSVKADLVIPVPDSGNWAAMGFAEESGIPFGNAFVRNHYVGRTFLQPSQLIRDFGVRVKLNLIKEMVAGKRVVVVDDSIVRGTTARARLTTLREAGAKEVHMRVSCPPHKWPCAYGIDFPTRKELMAANNAEEQIRDFLGADSLGYLSLESMIAATGLPASEFCAACYTGNYPSPFESEHDKFVMEQHRTRSRRPVSELVRDDAQQKFL